VRFATCPSHVDEPAVGELSLGEPLGGEPRSPLGISSVGESPRVFPDVRRALEKQDFLEIGPMRLVDPQEKDQREGVGRDGGEGDGVVSVVLSR